MSTTEKIFQIIDGYRDEVISLQRTLTARIALGPENGGSGEHEKTEFIRGLLEALRPSRLETIKAPDDTAQDGYRPNLIADWEGVEGEPTVWVLSHSDIVPPGDLSLWEGDPYQIKVKGDKIIGRGVEDNQHGFISGYLGLKAVLESGQGLKRKVGLVIVADEETGSHCGLGYLLKKHINRFDRDDLIVVPDGGSDEGAMIEVAETSLLWLKFTVTGRQCHATVPDRGKNTLFGAARLIVSLAELKKRFDRTEDLFSPPESTFEPTKMEANVPNVNTIPGKNIFFLDCRVLPQYQVDEVLSVCREIASEIETELDLDIAVDIAYRQEATRPTSTEAPVVKALERAIRGVTGKEAKPMGIGGGTVAAFFRRVGLPAAVWSTGFDSAHQPNEYCLISNILTDAKIFVTLYMGE